MAICHHSATEKPVIYLMKLGSRKRLCHVDHFARVTSTDSEPDVDDVPDLELRPAQTESDVFTPTLRSKDKGTNMPVAVQHSTRDLKVPQRNCKDSHFIFVFSRY